MRYDELTGDMIDDDYSSTPYRSGYFSDANEILSENYYENNDLRERVINCFKSILQVTVGIFLGAVLIFFGIMVKDRYDNGRWNTFSETLDKFLLRNNKQPSHDSAKQPQQVLKPEEELLKPEEEPINRISTSCCYCNGGFVVELHGSPESFDVSCPYCYRSIHYAKNH